MRALTTNPIVFPDGDILAPEDLNAGSLYLKDALIDVSQKRWAHGIMVIPFVADVATPYTDAMLGTEQLVFRFFCAQTCVVERGYLSADMVSTADVQWSWTKTSGGATPTGCTVPWLSTGAAVASATVDTIDENVDRFVLDAGSEYLLTITSAGTFTINRGDIILHVAVDRFNTTGTPTVPNPQPSLFVDVPPNATTLANSNAALATEVAKLANNNAAVTPALFVRNNFVLATPAAELVFPIPTFATARAQFKLTRAYLSAFMASTLGGTVSAVIKNAAGVTQATITANVAGVTQKSQDSGALAIALTGGDASDTTKDFSVTFANSNAVNCIKCTLILWFSRT